MKISPIPSVQSVAPQGEGQLSQVDTIRRIKMNVNRTPGQEYAAPPQTTEEPAQNLSILDTNESQATVDATQPLSPQIAELARRRRALQAKERELQDREKALATKSQGSDSVPLARLKSEPLSVLLESGVTYDQLAEAIIANQGNSELNSLKAEVNALKEGFDKKLTERDKQAEQQVLAEMRKDAERLVSSDDAFELVRETKSVPDVIELIERTYRQTGEVLDVTEACKLVEEELFNEAKRIANLKKVQAQLTPPASQMQTPQMRQMKTLTNRDTASVPLSPRARALAAFYGNLKK